MIQKKRAVRPFISLLRDEGDQASVMDKPVETEPERENPKLLLLTATSPVPVVVTRSLPVTLTTTPELASVERAK